MSWREVLNVGQLFFGNESIQMKPVKAVQTVGAEATNVIDVAVQLKDAEGKNLSEVAVLDFYLADDAAGATPSTVAPTGGVAAGAAGAIIESVADLSGKLVTDANGVVNVALTDVGTPTFYLVLVLPTGGLAISGAITFA